MFRLLYSSTPIGGLGALELDEIVTCSRLNNQQRNIAGFLVLVGGRFLQVLEGPPRSVSDLMDRIWNDPRHQDVEILLTEHDTRPHTLTEAMTFVRLDPPALASAEAIPKVKSVCMPVWSKSPALRTFLRSHAGDFPELSPD